MKAEALRGQMEGGRISPRQRPCGACQFVTLLMHRSVASTETEDPDLVKSWKEATKDAIQGTDQQSASFWESVGKGVPGRDLRACVAECSG
jgi:hypothetical protein